MAATIKAIKARDHQDMLVRIYLKDHPEEAEKIVRMSESWFGRSIIITKLLGSRDRALNTIINVDSGDIY